MCGYRLVTIYPDREGNQTYSNRTLLSPKWPGGAVKEFSLVPPATIWCPTSPGLCAAMSTGSLTTSDLKIPKAQKAHPYTNDGEHEWKQPNPCM